MSSFYSDAELIQLGFNAIGDNVRISRKASFYGISKISLGNNVRIDDFCILSGDITIGSHVHISAYSAIYGNMGVKFDDYSGLSPRCTIFSAIDDFSGNFLIGPIHNQSLVNIIGGLVHLKKHTQVGAGSVIFPSVIIEEGSVIGAMSLVKKSVSAWGIFAGIPCRKIKNRSKKLLNLLPND